MGHPAVTSGGMALLISRDPVRQVGPADYSWKHHPPVLRSGVAQRIRHVVEPARTNAPPASGLCLELSTKIQRNRSWFYRTEGGSERNVGSTVRQAFAAVKSRRRDRSLPE